MSLPACQVLRLGPPPHREVRALQESLAGQIAVGQIPPSLLLLEHPHTYTFGRRGKASNLLWDEATLRRRGGEGHWVDRGGRGPAWGWPAPSFPAPPGFGFSRMSPPAAHTARRPPASGLPRLPPSVSGWMRAASAGTGSPSTCTPT